MTIPDCTLTTCCFDTSKYNKDALSIDKIIERIDTVLQLPIYLVIYTEPIFIDGLKQKRHAYGLTEYTQFIVMEFKDMWCYNYLEKVKTNREVYFPTRDSRTSAESHIITCNKFDFVLQTINVNPFNTTKFGWIDAFLGIDNKIRICEDYSIDIFLQMLNNINDDKFHIQILNVNDKKYKLPENKKEYYNQYRYVVCGGLFICGKEIGIKICNRLKDIFIETTEYGFGHGEEMLYLEILDEFYDDIEKSYGDYGQIINNFIHPTRNSHYIYYLIIKRYLDFGYNKECYDCCKKVLYSIENQYIPCGFDIYFKILYAYYISSYYHNQTETLTILNNIMDLINTNLNIKIEYEKEKIYYDSMFVCGFNLRPKYKLVINIFACATIEKYKMEILKINETWGKVAEEMGFKLLFFLGEELTDLMDTNKYIYLKNIKNDYASAAYKQNLGLKYIYENYDADFVYTCGTDTYINIENLKKYMNEFNKNNNLYIGGHGDIRQIGNLNIFFHSGGSGFIISNHLLKKIYPILYNIQDTWRNICNVYDVIYLIDACDVQIAYYIHKYNPIYITSSDMYGCNYKGYMYNYKVDCCSKKIKMDTLIACHQMSLQDFDDYTNILHI